MSRFKEKPERGQFTKSHSTYSKSSFHMPTTHRKSWFTQKNSFWLYAFNIYDDVETIDMKAVENRGLKLCAKFHKLKPELVRLKLDRTHDGDRIVSSIYYFYFADGVIGKLIIARMMYGDKIRIQYYYQYKTRSSVYLKKVGYSKESAKRLTIARDRNRVKKQKLRAYLQRKLMNTLKKE